MRAPEPTGGPQFVVDDAGGVLVMVDGQPQSHVDLDDPGLLTFEYVQALAAVLDTLPPGPLAVTHVGGAGLTLPRYLNHTRPGTPQIVLEPDAGLTELVRRELPLPRRHRIRVRPLDGRTGVAALADASADAVVVDAYAAGRVPAELATAEWFGELRRVLRDGGLLLVNAADEPSRRWLARLHAALAQEFPHTAGIALHEVWKGRRFGNTVLLASTQPLNEPDLARAVARLPASSGLRGRAQLQRLLGDARPLTDADPAASPQPPSVGAWRLR